MYVSKNIFDKVAILDAATYTMQNVHSQMYKSFMPMRKTFLELGDIYFEVRNIHCRKGLANVLCNGSEVFVMRTIYMLVAFRYIIMMCVPKVCLLTHLIHWGNV